MICKPGLVYIFVFKSTENISDLVLAISGEMNSCLFKTLLDAEEKEVEVTTMPVVYEEILGRVPILLLEADWIIRSFVNESHAGARITDHKYSHDQGIS